MNVTLKCISNTKTEKRLYKYPWQLFKMAPNKKRKSACARMRSIPTGRLYSHLASEQDTTGPGQSPAQDVFF